MVIKISPQVVIVIKISPQVVIVYTLSAASLG